MKLSKSLECLSIGESGAKSTSEFEFPTNSISSESIEKSGKGLPSHSHQHYSLHSCDVPEDESPSDFWSGSKESDDEEESRHFANVCHAFESYSIDALREVARMERDFQSLSENDKSLLCESIPDRISKIKEAIEINQAFINLFLLPEEDTLHFDKYTTGGDLMENSNKNVEFNGYQNKSINSDGPKHLILDSKEIGSRSNSSPESGEAKNIINTSISTNPSSYETISGGKGFCNSSNLNAEKRHIPPINRAKLERHCRKDHILLARNVSKVRSTLRQFVRDWSEEGLEERNAAYNPLLNALMTYVPITDRKNPPKVLCPGSGLGRLPFEVVMKGYSCQGNEFSYFMLLGSNLVLNHSLRPKSCLIMPYCLSSSNRKSHSDHLQMIFIPDKCPSDYVTPGHDFSMCAGEFVEVYSSQIGEWDAVLTCYFIDTAKNIIQYIKTIANILKKGGLWANFGPLLYHFADMPSAMSIELSWEEIETIIRRFFTIKTVEWRDSHYTTNFRSMMQMLYHCVFFVALRNDVPVSVE